MLLCGEPGAIKRAMQFVGKDMQTAFLFIDLAQATFALGIVVEVVRAVLDDVFRQLVLVYLDCLHSASEGIRTPNPYQDSGHARELSTPAHHVYQFRHACL